MLLEEEILMPTTTTAMFNVDDDDNDDDDDDDSCVRYRVYAHCALHKQVMVCLSLCNVLSSLPN